MATSWSQRKSLGRRYGTDPALQMEMERLKQEYGLAPGREARALQASQFQQSLGQQDKALAQQQSQYDETNENAKSAGMMGTVANTGMTAATLRAMTMEKGEPFFGKTATGMWDRAWGNTPSVATTGMSQPVAGYTATTPGTAAIQPASNVGFWTGPQAGTPQYAVNPATMPEASTGVGLGSAASGAAYGSQGGIGTGIGALESGLGSAVPYLGPVAAGYSAPKILESAMPGANENLGHNLSLGLLKGEKDAKRFGSAATGAAAGAALGSVVPGIGTIAGGIIGGIVGGISEIFGW